MLINYTNAVVEFVFRGLDLDGATVGLAFVKGICSDFSSAGIDQVLIVMRI